MTESEKRAKILAMLEQLQADMLSTSRTSLLFSSTESAVKAAVDHSLEVEQTYIAMSKNGLTTDDLIDAYNRGSQQAFDFAVSFFYSAYAIALHERGRNVIEVLNNSPLPEERKGVMLKAAKLNDMTRRGIKQSDLQYMERLGTSEAKREMGIDRFIATIRKVEDEDLVDRVQEIMDEEIIAEDIMERCKAETGVDIKTILGIE